MTSDDVLRGPEAELVLRYLKHRWPRAVEALDALPAELPWTELDLDPDVIELERAAGRSKLEAIAAGLLTLPPLADDAPALRALAPELVGPRALAFLRIAGVNLALRLRTAELLPALLADAASGPPPRPAPALAGALVGRCRSMRGARALIEASPLAGPARDAALAALHPHLLPPGARMFIDAAPDAIDRAFALALKPLAPVDFSRPPAGARRFVLLRRRGGFAPAMAEGDDLPLDLARAIARQAGVKRVAWVKAAAGAPSEVAIFEGSRVVIDTASLAAELGGPPTDDDVCGALLAFAVTDLDPEHPRGTTPLVFAAHLGSGPPLGIERKLRRANVHPLAFG